MTPTLPYVPRLSGLSGYWQSTEGIAPKLPGFGRGQNTDLISFASQLRAKESKLTSYAIDGKEDSAPVEVPERSRSRMRRSLKVFPTVVLGFISFFTVSSALFSQTGGTPSVSLPGSQSPFQGSAPEGTATPEVLQIDFKDAIDRGLRNNLGLLLAGDQSEAARGQRWQQLAELLPNISVRAAEDAQTQSLTALGLKASVFHAPVPELLGPSITSISEPMPRKLSSITDPWKKNEPHPKRSKLLNSVSRMRVNW